MGNAPTALAHGSSGLTAPEPLRHSQKGTAVIEHGMRAPDSVSGRVPAGVVPYSVIMPPRIRGRRGTIMVEHESTQSADFIRAAVKEDLKAGRYTPRAHPLPAGAERLPAHRPRQGRSASTSASRQEFGGQCNLRFDDTNPAKEEVEYVESIKEDIRWLGFDWEDRLFYASDYFEQLYEWAVQLIRKGKAYVCDLSAEEIREYRGTLTEPGKDSPYRDRSVEENLDLFERMRAGRVPRRLAHAARQDRHGLAQHQHARPGDVPHPARRASSHRRQVVHLSDVRLRPRAVRLDRGHHPFALHAGVRGSTARSTTGSWTSWRSTIRARSSLPA